MSLDQPGRQRCRCGTTMEYRGKSEPKNGGHHASVFYCPDCDREVLRG